MSDEKYLQLVESEQGILADYFEENQKQTLNALGPIQDVNIFVGSTNAGKSRLLRWIMNNKSFTLFNKKNLIDSVSAMRMLCRKLADDIKHSKPHSVLMKYVNNQGWGTQIVYPREVQESKALEYISQCHLLQRNTITFDSEFFDNMVKALDAILSSGSKDTTIQLNAAISTNATALLKNSLASIQLIVLVVKLPILGGIIQLSFPLQGTVAELYKSRFEAISNDLAPLINLLDESWQSFTTASRRIYIPVLRTAVPLKVSESQYDDQIYSRSIRERYRLEQNVNIFSGLELYQTILIARANEVKIRDRLATFCKFLSETFFGGQSGDLVSLHESLKKGHRINYSVNGIERPLHHLGDGIQAVIVLMYQLFMAEPTSWIFIEEPELNLHPGFQRIVIDTILNNTTLKEKKLTIFMTTHSNHLLDISIPEYRRVSIFSLERFVVNEKESFIVRSVNNKRMHALTTLGATNSSVFMANCSIWVEGITDRKYLRAYLKAYSKSNEAKGLRIYQEDIHYSFFEYAGSNLEHYIFAADDDVVPAEDEDKIRAQFIANRVFLLADLDNGKIKKHKKWSEQKYEHFTYQITAGKEVENMLSEVILKSLLRSGFINGVNSSMIDSTTISYLEYQTIGMGKYLADKFNLGDSVKEASGTLNSYYKNKLADEVIKLINNSLADDTIEEPAWRLLSEDAKSLTRQIYKFIEKHNLGAAIE